MEILMGNEAMGLAAIHAGVDFVSGYPGTPSTEILEYIAKNNKDKDIYVEWSINEKAGVEVAAGASYSGKRALVTMKQVGLNASADPIMNLAYIGARGGLVIIVADDPGPISSQTEQDTRAYGKFANIPVLDPSSPEEAYRMVIEAFDISESFQCPVIVRPTTRVCHGSEAFEPDGYLAKKDLPGFKKDKSFVIFPALSYAKHEAFKTRNEEIAKRFSKSPFNKISKNSSKGIISSGVVSQYIEEVLESSEEPYSYLKLGTSFPFPKDLVLDFIRGLDEVLVVEDLSPYIEEEVFKILGSEGLKLKVLGKEDGTVPYAGELSTEKVKPIVYEYLGQALEEDALNLPKDLPARPPVLCAGCPHRGSFYAIKKAMEGEKTIYGGDIGCYTLGNAQPLDMVDTCLCMGAGITIAQGVKRAEEDIYNFAFVGDSTFFHSGITGVINAVYNQTDLILVVLDNSTTAMTGKQPHPGTGYTMMDVDHEPVSIPKVLEAVGVDPVIRLDPFDTKGAIKKIQGIKDKKGVRALVFEMPCIKIYKKEKTYQVDEEKCIGCKKCARDLGCPALVKGEKGKITIDQDLCYGCSICQGLCPTGAIKEVKRD